MNGIMNKRDPIIPLPSPSDCKIHSGSSFFLSSKGAAGLRIPFGLKDTRNFIVEKAQNKKFYESVV